MKETISLVLIVLIFLMLVPLASMQMPAVQTGLHLITNPQSFMLTQAVSQIPAGTEVLAAVQIAQNPAGAIGSIALSEIKGELLEKTVGKAGAALVSQVEGVIDAGGEITQNVEVSKQTGEVEQGTIENVGGQVGEEGAEETEEQKADVSKIIDPKLEENDVNVKNIPKLSKAKGQEYTEFEIDSESEIESGHEAKDKIKGISGEVYIGTEEKDEETNPDMKSIKGTAEKDVKIELPSKGITEAGLKEGNKIDYEKDEEGQEGIAKLTLEQSTGTEKPSLKPIKDSDTEAEGKKIVVNYEKDKKESITIEEGILDKKDSFGEDEYSVSGALKAKFDAENKYFSQLEFERDTSLRIKKETSPLKGYDILANEKTNFYFGSNQGEGFSMDSVESNKLYFEAKLKANKLTVVEPEKKQFYIEQQGMSTLEFGKDKISVTIDDGKNYIIMPGQEGMDSAKIKIARLDEEEVKALVPVDIKVSTGKTAGGLAEVPGLGERVLTSEKEPSKGDKIYSMVISGRTPTTPVTAKSGVALQSGRNLELQEKAISEYQAAEKKLGRLFKEKVAIRIVEPTPDFKDMQEFSDLRKELKSKLNHELSLLKETYKGNKYQSQKALLEARFKLTEAEWWKFANNKFNNAHATTSISANMGKTTNHFIAKIQKIPEAVQKLKLIQHKYPQEFEESVSTIRNLVLEERDYGKAWEMIKQIDKSLQLGLIK